MHWHKLKHIVSIKSGLGSFKTEEMRGIVDHLIVIPSKEDMEWDMQMFDKQGDCIFHEKNHQGRLDDKSGLPIGTSTQEKVSVLFNNVSLNEPITVIFRVRDES